MVGRPQLHSRIFGAYLRRVRSLDRAWSLACNLDSPQRPRLAGDGQRCSPFNRGNTWRRTFHRASLISHPHLGGCFVSGRREDVPSHGVPARLSDLHDSPPRSDLQPGDIPTAIGGIGLCRKSLGNPQSARASRRQSALPSSLHSGGGGSVQRNPIPDVAAGPGGHLWLPGGRPNMGTSLIGGLNVPHRHCQQWNPHRWHRAHGKRFWTTMGRGILSCFFRLAHLFECSGAHLSRLLDSIPRGQKIEEGPCIVSSEQSVSSSWPCCWLARGSCCKM